MGVGVLPQKVYQLMGRPLGLVGMPLDDDWAERSLVLVVRDVDALSPVSRLLFDHLRTVEAREAAEAQTEPPPTATQALRRARSRR
jgi:hypothetical protein